MFVVFMTIEELHIEPIAPLHGSDTVIKGLDQMEELKISHLPLIDDNGKYLGLLSEDALLAANDERDPVSAVYNPAFAPFVLAGAHFFEVLEVFVQNRLSVLPVVDRAGILRDTFMWHGVAEWFRNTPTLVQPGAVIVLEMQSHEYSLVEISSIVEHNDCKILGLWLGIPGEAGHVQITLKLNSTVVSPIVQSLLRYGYSVPRIYGDSEFEFEHQSRIDNLLNYLKF